MPTVDYSKKMRQKYGHRVASNGSKPNSTTAPQAPGDDYYAKHSQKVRERYSIDLGTVSVNDFLKKANDYFSSAQSQLKSTGYSSATKNADDRRKQAQELRREAMGVEQYIEKNRGLIDDATYNSLKRYISDIGYETSKVTDAFDTAMEYYNQFSDREKLNDYRENIRQNAWLEKYQGKTYTDLSGIVSEMEAGDEKNWVSRFAESIYTPEEGRAEIDHLEKVLGEYKALSRTMIDDKMKKRLDYITENYGDEKGIKDRISERKQYLTLFEREQEKQRMLEVGNSESDRYDPEFNYWAKKRGTLPTAQELENYDTMMDKSTWQTREDGTVVDLFGNEIGRDEKGNVIHPSSGSVNAEDRLGIYLASKSDSPEYSVAENTWGTLDKIIAEGDSRHWDRLTPEQIDTYYYYLNKEGAESASRYLDLIQDTVNKNLGAEMYAEMQDDSKALKALFGLSAGVEQWEAGLGGFGRQLRGEDDYVAPSAKQYAGQQVREDLDGFWGVAYDAASTVGNMAPSFLTGMLANAIVPGSGFVGSLVMGAGASGSAYDQMINEGFSVEQARTYGSLIGAAEVGLQALLGGISKLGGGMLTKGTLKAMSAADNALLKLAVKAGETQAGRILTNMISEGTEEGLQEIIGTWLKNLITYADEDVDWGEAAYSALLGAITGGVFESSSVALETAKTNAMLRDTGETIIGADSGVDALKALAMDVSGANPKLTKLADKVTGETATGKGIGKVVAAVKNSNNQKRVGKLYQTVGSEVTKQNSADIAKALNENGFSKKSAENIAEAASARINGEKLNKFQEAVLESVRGNTMVDEAVNKIINNPESGVSKRTGNMETYSFGIMLGKGIAPEVTREAQKTTLKVSEEGKTTVDGKETDIKFADDGKIVTESGTVDAKEAEFASVTQAYLVETIADLGLKADAANNLLQTATEESLNDLQAQAFATGLKTAYRLGRIGNLTELHKNYFTSRLTSEQRVEAYSAGLRDRNLEVEAKQKAINEAKLKAEKFEGTGGVFFRANDMAVSNIDSYMKDTTGLSDMQKTAIETMKYMAKAIGTEFYVYESYEKNGKLFYIDENGNEQAGAPNGWYDPTTGKIYIDLHAGKSARGTMLFTIAHELTHHIRQNSPEKFNALADIVVNKSKLAGNVSGLIKEKMRRAQDRGNPISEDTAYEEVIADSMESILTSGRVMEIMTEIKQQDKTLWDKICDWFKDFLSYLKRVTSAYEGTDPDSYEGKMVAELDSVIRELEQVFAEGLVDTGEVNLTTMERAGVTFDADTKSVAPLMSERTWTESEYVQNKEEAAKAISKQLGVSVAKATQYINDINSVAKLIADDRARLDYEPNMDAHATVLKPNSEYKYTVDMSTLCAKRLLFTGTFDAIQKAFPNTVFDSEDIVRLREMMMKRNLEVACGICYVESTRREIGRITQEFIDRYKVAQKTGNPISRINSSGKEVTLSAKGITFNADPNYTPTLGELNTTDIDIVKRDHREVYDAYLAFMNARGQAKPKLLETRTEYKGEILKHFKAKSAVNSRNAHGGLRLQSFSDFEVPHMIDMMQVILDMSRVGLKSQAYTKVSAFADVFGGTGVKINLSLIAKGSGLDANGNLVFDDVEGINHKEAFRLREKYSKNVGTILVGKSESHIIAAMADPHIDFIIPFHKSSWKESLYKALGLTGYEDFTETQNEKPIDKSRKIENFDPSEYWDFSKTGDENAQVYLRKCREDGRIPKFPQFQGFPGYWKLLVDFKMYDNNGVGSPQEVVHPDFDMDAANKILAEYQGGHRSFPVAKDVVTDFVNEYEAINKAEATEISGEIGVLYSSRDVTSWDIDWDEDNNSSIKSQMVKHADEINSMKPVATVEFDKSKGKTYAEILDETLRTKFGYKIERADGVSFLFDKVAIATLRRYVNSDEEAAAVISAPYVLKRGKAISGHKNHKGNRYPSVTYAAPVTINEDRVNVAVVVLFGDKNRPHSLRVLMPSGKEYVLKKIETDPKRKWASPNGGVQSSTGSASMNSIRNAKGDVNKKFSDRDAESFSARSLLANALESVAQHEVELQKLQEYKEKISSVEAKEKRLREINGKLYPYGKSMSTKERIALQDEAAKLRNQITIIDKQLLRLEAAKPLQNVLNRERARVRREMKAQAKEDIRAVKKAEQKRYQEFAESRNRTVLRHKIKNVVNELNQYLLKGTKDRHVPIELQKAVAEALDAVNMDTVGAEDRIAKLQAELMKAKTPEKIQEISRKIDHIQQMGDRMNDRLKKLKDAYDQFVNSDDPLIANSHDEVISNKLQAVIESVGETPLRDMTLTQLEDVYDMYRMVLTTIRNANKVFKAKKSESISVVARQVMAEVKKAGGNQKLSAKGMDGVKNFMWNNLKPVYAFELIGSEAFTEVFNAVRAGEDVWAVDVTEARAFYLDKSEKYGYNSWDFNKRYDFKSTSGMDFSLDLEQIMSLYAYSKRDQAADHLRRGGIVIDETTEITVKNKLGIPLKFNPTEATAYNISDVTLADIISKLTAEQKSFVDEMQDYLSTVMGTKGNEVSLEMYGVKLFKEKFYFPLKSAQQFMAKAKEQQKGEVKIKNSGFSKETVQKASNPIVLTPFMNVWADHVNEMSMYHAFVLPMEDFYRVYSFKTPTSETTATESVEMFIQNAYGKGATKYIDQLLKDLNGGARTDNTTDFINKMMGLFKKGAVFASMSVVVQQPSAIARAAALVDTKYFIGPKVDHKKHKLLWDEVKKYAPVAIIKEMGYFDTNMGKSTQDFITGKEYSGFKEKMKALFTDSGYRDEALSKAPALADEIAWCGIWEAVKRETKDKNPNIDTKSEAFLKKVGERFTEVIVKTQVYDSVLSRSGNMRSKDTGMKMATAFMAEPTTSINMIADALLKGKRGDRKYARNAIGAVIASQIINSFLVSFVYAGRDDDDEKTYVEKYTGTLTGEVLDSLNPAAYIPFIKDIISIAKGYSVERSDMAVISDLWNAWVNLKKDTMSPYKKVEGFAGSIAQLFGLPVKNIMRDVRSIYQTIDSFVNGERTTKAGTGYAVKSALPKVIGGGDVTNQEQLYKAYIKGDADHQARVESRYTTEKKAQTAMRSAIKDHYLAGDIDAEDAIQYMVNYCGDEKDEAFWKIEEWKHDEKFEEDFGKYNEFYRAVKTGTNLRATIKKYTDNGVTEETLRTQITDYFKDKYIKMTIAEKANIKGYLLNAMTVLGNKREEAEEKLKDWEFESANGFSYENRKEEYLDGNITGDQLRNALVKYGGKTNEEADSYIASLDFEAEHGFVYDEKKEKFLSGEITAAELKEYIMTVDDKAEDEANAVIVRYVREAYDEGEIDRSYALSVMVAYAGLIDEEAENKLRYIDVKKQFPDTYIDDAWVDEYYEEVEPSGISLNVFVEYRNQVKGLTGEGKKEKRMAIINSMPISNTQKDALYFAEGWAESRLREAPWH